MSAYIHDDEGVDGGGGPSPNRREEQKMDLLGVHIQSNTQLEQINDSVANSSMANSSSVAFSNAGGPDGEENEEKPPKKKEKWYFFGFDGIIRDFDNSFLFLLGLQYLDQGFRALTTLGIQLLFKDYYKLNPGLVQKWQSFIIFPWTIKILYGIISDNLAIFGSRKKSYIMIGGLMQFGCLQIIFWFNINNVTLAATLFMLVNLSTAFMDVIVDSMMVIQSRRDPERGSERLNAFSWIIKGFGGIMGSSLAALLTQHFHPKWCFLVYSILGIFVFISGCRLKKDIDEEGLEDKEGFIKDLKRSFYEIWQIRKLPMILKVLLYMVIRGLLVPSFGTFWYYYEVDVKDFSQLYIGLMKTVGYVALILGSVLFQVVFANKEFRLSLFLESFLTCCFGLIGAIFVLDLHEKIGFSNEVFYAIKSFFEEAFSMTFELLPISALFAKITPRNIEGTVFALLTGVSNLTQGVLSPWTGSLINDYVTQVTKENLSSSNFITLVWFQTFMALIPILFIWLIPKRQQVQKYQKLIEEEQIRASSMRQTRLESSMRKSKQGESEQLIDADASRDLSEADTNEMK